MQCSNVFIGNVCINNTFFSISTKKTCRNFQNSAFTTEICQDN